MWGRDRQANDPANIALLLDAADRGDQRRHIDEWRAKRRQLAHLAVELVIAHWPARGAAPVADMLAEAAAIGQPHSHDGGLDGYVRILFDRNPRPQGPHRLICYPAIGGLRQPGRVVEECDRDAVLDADLGLSAGLNRRPVGTLEHQRMA